MNPRGPPGTPTDIETFPYNHKLKSVERTPLQFFTYLLKIMRKRSAKKISFSFLFQHLDFFFSGKSARVSFVFRTFPNLQNLMKTFKNTSKLQFINFHIRTPRPQPNQTQYTYIYIYFFQIIKTFKPSSIPCIILSKDWA